MTIELLLCEGCAMHLECIFPDFGWITDMEHSEKEDIEYHLFLEKSMKHVEKCEICKRCSITTSKYHHFDSVDEMEESFLKLVKNLKRETPIRDNYRKFETVDEMEKTFIELVRGGMN